MIPAPTPLSTSQNPKSPVKITNSESKSQKDVSLPSSRKQISSKGKFLNFQNSDFLRVEAVTPAERPEEKAFREEVRKIKQMATQKFNQDGYGVSPSQYRPAPAKS